MENFNSIGLDATKSRTGQVLNASFCYYSIFIKYKGYHLISKEKVLWTSMLSLEERSMNDCLIDELLSGFYARSFSKFIILLTTEISGPRKQEVSRAEGGINILVHFKTIITAARTSWIVSWCWGRRQGTRCIDWWLSGSRKNQLWMLSA